MEFTIAEEDPATADVVQLLEAHVAFAVEVSPRECVHALDIEGLRVPEITFWTARTDGELAGVGALKEHAGRHGEIKSMHTVAAVRGKGVARAILVAMIERATERGYERISLETGSTAPFAPARALYERMGFSVCGPFAHYEEHPHSTFMTIAV